MRALSAGKHVFTEKPLGVTADEGRRLVDTADTRGLVIGSAPDTFLGAAGRHARRLMEAGIIGKPVTGTAFMMGRGMEHWHPDPSFYYQPGAGPLMDMGPYYLTMMVNLLGPVRRVQAMATKGQEERLITAEGPFKNTTFKVGTPTNVLSLLEFRSGATVTFGASWDVFKHSNHPIELHGTEGSLRLPDPDTFGGTVSLSRHAVRTGRISDTAKAPSTVLVNWPDHRARPRQLPHARRRRSGALAQDWCSTARVRHSGTACAGDHGGDPAFGRNEELGRHCRRCRPAGTADRGRSTQSARLDVEPQQVVLG